MKKYDELYSNINNLLSSLRASDVVKHVNRFYVMYGNSAPGESIETQMRELQAKLDNAE